LPLDNWQANLSVNDIHERLLAIRGIGPWTVNYTLLRGFGWLDGSLHGDVAVRRGMQILLNHPDKISEAAARQWLADFSPWRALLAAHLWASLSLKPNKKEGLEKQKGQSEDWPSCLSLLVRPRR
jgi:DNA-3-methyladenine glycosylase II